MWVWLGPGSARPGLGLSPRGWAPTGLPGLLTSRRRHPRPSPPMASAEGSHEEDYGTGRGCVQPLERGDPDGIGFFPRPARSGCTAGTGHPARAHTRWLRSYPADIYACTMATGAAASATSNSRLITADRTDVLAPALVAAHRLSARLRHRSSQVRHLFFNRLATDFDVDEVGSLPLVRELRGGRGGSVRLRLHLSLLWASAAPPHDTAFPARFWATLLGLPDPDGNGARRVKAAIDWLEQNRFIDVEAQSGRQPRLRLLHESGDGQRYEPPGAVLARHRGDSILDGTYTPELYTKMPAQVWTNGWMAQLSGAGIAVLLTLLRSSDTTEEIWYSPDFARSTFGFSEDTRTTGLRELERLGAVERHRRTVGGDFDQRRYRNTYTLTLGPAPTTQDVGRRIQ